MSRTNKIFITAIMLLTEQYGIFLFLVLGFTRMFTEYFNAPPPFEIVLGIYTAWCVGRSLHDHYVRYIFPYFLRWVEGEEWYNSKFK